MRTERKVRARVDNRERREPLHRGEIRTEQRQETRDQQMRTEAREQRVEQKQDRPEQVRVEQPREQQQARISEQPPVPVLKTEQQLSGMPYSDLIIYARRFGIVGASLLHKDKLIEKILDMQEHVDKEIG